MRLLDGSRRKKLKKTIEYDVYDYGVIMLIQAYLQRLMDEQPSLNSMKNKLYQEPYQKGQESLLKFQTYFDEMMETYSEK